MKKHVLVVLVLMMILVLAGCAKNQTEETATPTGSASESSATQASSVHKWWQDGEAYEVYASSFCDSDGDGTGDLNGIASKMGYLEGLGIDAVWITPVYASPMVDNGYDVSDYYSINPLYGTMDDMDRLIQTAEEHGVKIVMDLVVNHTSDQNEWFIESCRKGQNKYTDYYIWRDAKADGSAPNNWRSIFGGSAWTWNEERGQYYLHTFASQQPDLNWENPDVRREVCDVARFWLDKGVGGFRIDAVPYIKKPADFSDAPSDGEDGLASIHKATANTEGILDYLKEFKDSIRSYEDCFTVGEANGVKPEELTNWVGENGVFDMLFEFNHLPDAEVWCDAPEWSVNDTKTALFKSQAGTADNGWYPIFFENHDKSRIVDSIFDQSCDKTASAKAIGTMLYTLRGTPFVYEGQEIGMTNCTWQYDECNDVNVKGQYDLAIESGYTDEEAMGFVNKYTRDNARTPMQWSGSANAGFTTGEPWLKVNPNYTSINVESEEGDGDSVLEWYKTMSSLRQGSDVLKNGDFTPLLEDLDSVIAYRRTFDGESLIVINNLGNKESSFDASLLEGYSLLMTSCASNGDPVPGSLRPLESVVYTNAESGSH